jgi:hypothetical protein
LALLVEVIQKGANHGNDVPGLMTAEERALRIHEVIQQVYNKKRFFHFLSSLAKRPGAGIGRILSDHCLAAQPSLPGRHTAKSLSRFSI